MSPGTSSLRGNGRPGSVSERPGVDMELLFKGLDRAGGVPLFQQGDDGVRHQQDGDDRGIRIFSENQGEDDDELEHPGGQAPELFQE